MASAVVNGARAREAEERIRAAVAALQAEGQAVQARTVARRARASMTTVAPILRAIRAAGALPLVEKVARPRPGEAAATAPMPVTPERPAGQAEAAPTRGAVFEHRHWHALDGRPSLCRIVEVAGGYVRFGTIRPDGLDGGWPRRPFIEVPAGSLATHVGRWV